MKTKIATALVAALTLGTIAVAGTSQAQAHHFHGGWGWGGVGLGLALGAAAAANSYEDAPTCYLSPQYNRYGRFIGNVKVCN
jgi:hypothetical protein